MKEKKIIHHEELERIDNELFGPFDPEDESWIGGMTQCLTVASTFTPTGLDTETDFDFPEIEGLSS